MRRLLFWIAIAALASARPMAATGAVSPVAAAVSPTSAVRVLVFSRTAGFRHDSIPDGIEAVRKLGAKGPFAMDATEDPTRFTPDNLARYRAVIFLNTTGDVLDPEQQAAFEKYIRKGGGYVGIHAATDTEYTWPWYARLVGAQFASHPHQQEAILRVEDRTHPSTKMLPKDWKRFDEWYNFRESPRGKVRVLLNLDESTYKDGKMGADHPASWYHEYDGGFSWYTAGGHTKESYSEPLFLEHILGGIRWASGLDRPDKAPGKATK